MSDQDTIFTADKATEVTTNNVEDNPLNVLVGEGKKYKSAEDLAKAYLSADDFIEKLKDENTSLRAKSEQIAKLDEVLARLEANSGSSTQDHSREVETPQSLSATDVAAIVEKTITGRETATSMKNNVLKADAKMKELFGKDAQTVFEEEASTPELKQTYLQLAQVNPDKFVEVFAALKKSKISGGQVDSNTGINTVNLQSVHSNRENDPECKEYYNKLRKENPNRYYSSEIQLAIQKLAANNGSKYYGR